MHTPHIATFFAWLLLASCAHGTDGDPATNDHQVKGTSAGQMTAVMEQHRGGTGKPYYPVIGARVPTPDGYTAKADDAGVAFTRPDGTIKLRICWEKDMASTYQQLIEGIRRGDELVATNGTTEDLGGGRTGFIVVAGKTSTGEILEFRYVVTGASDERGTFVGFATITKEDDTLMAHAKQDLLQLLGTVEVLPVAEAEALAASEKERTERKWRADLATVRTRKRTAEEQRFRNGLSGRALVKLTSESYPSELGSAYYYSTERFQLCPNGIGTWTFSNRSSISGTAKDDDGIKYETGSLYGRDQDHVHGEWDIEQHTDGMMLLIHTGDAKPSSWWITPNGSEGYIIGGKKFWFAGSDSEHGPLCEP